jgi:hypothetical protein
MDEATLRQEVEQQIEAAGNYTARVDSTTDFKDALADIVEETLAPMLAEIEANTKRQADKNETTKVFVGDREVAKSVEKQRNANGYSFTSVTA